MTGGEIDFVGTVNPSALDLNLAGRRWGIGRATGRTFFYTWLAWGKNDDGVPRIGAARSPSGLTELEAALYERIGRELVARIEAREAVRTFSKSYARCLLPRRRKRRGIS